MGLNVMNSEIVQDFSTDESFLRLHLDIKLPNSKVAMVVQLLEEGKVAEAFAYAKTQTGERNHGFVESAGKAMSEIVRNKAVKKFPNDRGRRELMAVFQQSSLNLGRSTQMCETLNGYIFIIPTTIQFCEFSSHQRVE